jgi:hypothetical protein
MSSSSRIVFRTIGAVAAAAAITPAYFVCVDASSEFRKRDDETVVNNKDTSSLLATSSSRFTKPFENSNKVCMCVLVMNNADEEYEKDRSE